MSDLRILHLRKSEGFYGAEKIILSLAERHTSESGCRTWIGCLNDARDPCTVLCDAASARRIRAVVFPCRDRFDIRCVRALVGLIRDERIRLIHGHGFKANAHALLAAAWTGIPCICTQHGWTHKNTIVRFWEAVDLLAMSAVRRVVAVSADIRDALEKIPRLKGKVSYIPNGVPLPDAAGASRRGARPWTVAIVGRLSIEKGHGIFLDAARRVLLKKPDVSFWVIGDGPLRETLEEQAGRLGVGSRVRFLGFRSDMDKLYPKIDLAASASLREGLPMALLEAMAHGKPVVATRVGDVPHIVRNGVNGYVVPPGDSEALENAMLRILAHPSRIRRFGKASRFIVESGYSSESMAASYLSLYREILGEGTA